MWAGLITAAVCKDANQQGGDDMLTTVVCLPLGDWWFVQAAAGCSTS